MLEKENQKETRNRQEKETTAEGETKVQKKKKKKLARQENRQTKICDLLLWNLSSPCFELTVESH